MAFAKAVDGQIVTSFTASAGARDAAGVWSPDEARKLRCYTREIGGRIYATELINEPNLDAMPGLLSDYDVERFAHDVAASRVAARRGPWPC